MNSYMHGKGLGVNPKVSKNNTRKLFHPWRRFKVEKKISEYTYRIQYHK